MIPGRLAIREYKKEDRDKWDAYVMAASHSACYHLIGWKNLIEKSFGHETYYLLSEDNEGKINGILPLVHLNSKIFGNFMVSVPYFNYGGICASNQEVCNNLLEEAIRFAKSRNAAHVELRHTAPILRGLPTRTSKVSMQLGLTKKAEELFNAFPSKLRSQIRRSLKEGMYARLGREDELESFYTVFSINMRDLGTPVYPKKFFRNILTEFPDTTWICTVYTKEGEPAASGFLVGFKQVIQIPWASSLRKYNRYGSNMLLYCSALEFACNKGFSIFDFGRSTMGESTYKFKEQWGAKPVQLYWHYWLRKGNLFPELNPENPKYKMVINIWQKLPVALTRILGPLIVKNLP